MQAAVTVAVQKQRGDAIRKVEGNARLSVKFTISGGTGSTGNRYLFATRARTVTPGSGQILE